MVDEFLVTEIFHSLQGEGAYVGVPSLFIRLHGCNMQCQGFGQPYDRTKWVSSDAMIHNNRIKLLEATTLDQLPVPEVGCDSSLSWSKHTRHLAQKFTPSQLASRAYTDLNSHASAYGLTLPHLILTGGEPLLRKWQPLLCEFFKELSDLENQKGLGALRYLTSITFETNGSQILSPDLIRTLNALDVEVVFSVSPKLRNSGEMQQKALRPEAIKSYTQIENSFMYFKYVVRDESQIKEIESFNRAYQQALECDGALFESNTFLMPEGGVPDKLKLTATDVANLALKYNYRYSPRLHMDLWQNQWGT